MISSTFVANKSLFLFIRRRLLCLLFVLVFVHHISNLNDWWAIEGHHRGFQQLHLSRLVLTGSDLTAWIQIINKIHDKRPYCCCKCRMSVHLSRELKMLVSGGNGWQAPLKASSESLECHLFCTWSRAVWHQTHCWLAQTLNPPQFKSTHFYIWEHFGLISHTFDKLKCFRLNVNN